MSDGTRAAEVMKSIGVRIEAEVIHICAVSDIGVDLLTGVDANVLRDMMTALGFIVVLALLTLSE